MHPDREALIAGIAADPDNDLRRLVFADWLEEHGEAERAEFIRLQIDVAKLPEGDERKTADDRAKQLFVTHGRQWFAPFLKALEPKRDELTGYRWPTEPQRTCSLVGRELDRRSGRYFVGAMVWRGFVTAPVLDLSYLPPCSWLTLALHIEPVSHLTVRHSTESGHWVSFSEPGLRRLRGFGLSPGPDGLPFSGDHPAFGDPNLEGVRFFSFHNPLGFARRGWEPLPLATVEAFGRSPLAEQVTRLGISLGDAGLVHLACCDRLRLDQFGITGTISRDGILALNVASFAPALQTLSLQATELTDDGVAALAEGRFFRELTTLDLSKNRLTDAALQSLATAPFIRQLEMLDLSGMSQKYEGKDTPGLCALAEALNPERLRRLRFASNGYKLVPPCLAKFGDRVDVPF